jgi:hypothetical protein
VQGFFEGEISFVQLMPQGTGLDENIPAWSRRTILVEYAHYASTAGRQTSTVAPACGMFSI